MDERKIIEDLKDIIPYVKGIIIYGSHVKGYADKNSDIDICVVKKEGIDEKELFYKILSTSNKYDIIIFDKAPWYIRGEIIENGKVIYAEDADELDFWLYKQSKIWNDMKRRRRRVTEDELLKRLKN